MKKAAWIIPLIMLMAGFGIARAEFTGNFEGKWVGEAKPEIYDDWCQGAPKMTINIKANGKIKGYASDKEGNRVRIKGAVKDGKINIFPLDTPIGTIKFITVDGQTDEIITGTWKSKTDCKGIWIFKKKK